MASRIPTIDFAHPQPLDFSRTDGRDHQLKQALKNVDTIVSCVVVDGKPRLEARAYPCDEAREAIPLSELDTYSNSHVWLQTVLCFCGYKYGTPRSVNIIKPRYDESAGEIVLGCRQWTRDGKADTDGREFCLYWLNLSKLCDSVRFAAALKLHAYPVDDLASIGKARHSSNHNIRRILGTSGGPSSSQESRGASSSLPSSPARMGTGPGASAAALARTYSQASDDSTVIIPSDLNERKAQRKPKRALFPRSARGPTMASRPPVMGGVQSAKAARPLPGPVIDVSDDERPPPSTQPVKRRVKQARASVALPGPIIDVSDDEMAGLRNPAVQSSGRDVKVVTAPAHSSAGVKAAERGGPPGRISQSVARNARPGPSLKRGAVDDNVIIISDEDVSPGGGGGGSSRTVQKVSTTRTKGAKRMRPGHMSTRGGHGVPGAGSLSANAADAIMAPVAPVEPDVFVIDGQAPGSQGAAFVATVSSVTGERTIYQLAGK